METKSLLFGLIGFFLGGLVVSVAATTFDKPNTTSDTSMTMDQMVDSLKDKRGDEFDKAFIAGMIAHHQGAVEMAKIAENNARHDEIKKMSRAIISTQNDEIEQMMQWQNEWGYSSHNSMGTGHNGH